MRPVLRQNWNELDADTQYKFYIDLVNKFNALSNEKFELSLENQKLEHNINILTNQNLELHDLIDQERQSK